MSKRRGKRARLGRMIRGWAGVGTGGPPGDPAARPAAAASPHAGPVPAAAVPRGQIRLAGVVRAMNRVRRQLAEGLPPEQHEPFRAHVADLVAQIERACHSRGLGPEALPGPSYAAYHYLKGLDLSRLPVPAAAGGGPAPGPAGTVPVSAVKAPGLTAFTQSVRERLLELARPQTGADRATEEAALHEAIRGRVASLERSAARQGLDLGTLAGPSLRAHQWLGWLAEPDNLGRQRETLALLADLGARAAGHPARPRDTRHWPITLDLYHGAALFRSQALGPALRGTASQLYVAAPEEVLMALVLACAGSEDGAHRSLARAFAHSEEAAEVALALELAGAPPRSESRGRYHDLAGLFERVNAAHFGGRLTPPKLAWSRTHTRSKLGHYQRLTDTVVLSLTLDDPRVPAYVLDFVMYHELLHRVLGVEVAGGRHLAHGPAFRRAERRFPDYARAQAFLHDPA